VGHGRILTGHGQALFKLSTFCQFNLSSKTWLAHELQTKKYAFFRQYALEIFTTRKSPNNHHVVHNMRAGATIRRISTAAYRVLGQRGRQKYSCVVQKVTNVHQRKGMNIIEVNETHDHAVYEKINVLHYFRFAVVRLIFLLLIFNFNLI